MLNCLQNRGVWRCTKKSVHLCTFWEPGRGCNRILCPVRGFYILSPSASGSEQPHVPHGALGQGLGTPHPVTQGTLRVLWRYQQAQTMLGVIFCTIYPLSFWCWMHQSGILSLIRNPLEINGSLPASRIWVQELVRLLRPLWMKGTALKCNSKKKFILPHIPIYRNIRASTSFSTLKGICCKNKAYQSLSTSQSAFCVDAKPYWAAATRIKPNRGRQRLIKRPYNKSVFRHLNLLE